MSYDRFLETSPQGSVFASTWWLDAVAPGRHRLITVTGDSSIEAAWPLVTTGTEKVIGMPPLTPWLGIAFGPHPSESLPKRLAREHALIDELVTQLPSFDSIRVSFHPAFDYWLPLSWQGFEQTTWYSYVLTDTSDEEALWANLQNNVRQNIRKARREGVTVESSDDLDAFWSLHHKTFLRQGLSIPYDRSIVDRVDEACRTRDQRRILLARSAEGEPVAGAYIVWDSRTVYYLMGGADAESRTSGAASLTMWTAIQVAGELGKAFDFEGSSLQPIERFFRSFGGFPRPYYELRKIASPSLRLRQAARILLGRQGW